MIELCNVYAGYEKELILKNINLEVRKGTITTIIGPNGCGKSTLLRCIARQLPIKSGEIKVNQEAVLKVSNVAYAKQVAFVPQAREIPMISVEGLVMHGRFPHLSFPRKLSKVDKGIVRQAMINTGVLELGNKMMSQLSGGERQKAYLAMALAQNTEILLLDEPTTYLDIHYQLELLGLLENLRDEGKTIITVLHDLSQAMQISDKVCIMEQGKIVLCNSPEKVYESREINRVFGVSSQTVDIDGKRYTLFLENKK